MSKFWYVAHIYQWYSPGLIVYVPQNELVMSRLQHEELETELVRYKLLYVPSFRLARSIVSP